MLEKKEAEKYSEIDTIISGAIPVVDVTVRGKRFSNVIIKSRYRNIATLQEGSICFDEKISDLSEINMLTLREILKRVPGK